jgi:hypothetical protein
VDVGVQTLGRRLKKIVVDEAQKGLHDSQGGRCFLLLLLLLLPLPDGYTGCTSRRYLNAVVGMMYQGGQLVVVLPKGGGGAIRGFLAVAAKESSHVLLLLLLLFWRAMRR